MENKLAQHIEALIFVADPSVTLKEIKSCLEEQMNTSFSKEELTNVIEELIQKYQQDNFAMEIIEISDGYRFMTKGAYHPVLSVYLKQSTNKKLSKTALETLAIIAYKQPVEKSEVEKIRGVGCDYSIQKLLEKELVEILGRSEGPGKPLLYGTSQKFMDYFGLTSIKDLPKTRDLTTVENQIGDEDILESRFEEE